MLQQVNQYESQHQSDKATIAMLRDDLNRANDEKKNAEAANNKLLMANNPNAKANYLNKQHQDMNKLRIENNKLAVDIVTSKNQLKESKSLLT